jgi:hypothetical protein
MMRINLQAEYLQKLLSNSQYSLLTKLTLLQGRKQLLSLFETGLKFIPPLFFEPTKLLNHFWYTYESSQAQNESIK